MTELIRTRIWKIRNRNPSIEAEGSEIVTVKEFRGAKEWGGGVSL